jgi:pimeloyl-ACP methyl ester carboxylesterase
MPADERDCAAGEPAAEVMKMRTGLAVFLLLAAAGQAEPGRVVDLKAADGTALKASYYAAGKPGSGVLLLHQVNRDRKSWDVLATRLAAAGIHTLALDLRGYGESGGARAEARKHAAEDIDAAWQVLAGQPGVNGDAIGLGGAGYLGVDAAVMAAQRHGAAAKSLVLLSGQAVIPGRQFMAQATQLPGLFVVADADEYPPTEEVMEWLYGLSRNPGSRFIHYVGPKAPWNGYETLPNCRHPARTAPICFRRIPS